MQKIVFISDGPLFQPEPPFKIPGTAPDPAINSNYLFASLKKIDYNVF